MAEQQLNEYGCKLFIDTEHEHPEIITQATGVGASEVIVKGAPFKTGKGKIIAGKYNEYNLWIYDTGKIYGEEGVYLNNSLQEIFRVLESKKVEFQELLEKYNKNHIL